MNENQRQRCQTAGIPDKDIERIDEAVSKFDSADTRDHVTNTLIEAWKDSHETP